jgi:hypothetical protein
MHDSTPSRTASADASERSLSDDLRQLAEDARALAQAELAFQKSRAAYAGGQAKWIAILGALAAVLVFFALMALTVGLVIALTPTLTAWGATAAVFVGLLIVAGLCALLAAGHWKRLAAMFSDGAE